jgi:peptidyl-prolyl cis-trans isomerase C
MRRSSRKKNSTKIFVAITVVAALIFVASNHFLKNVNEVVIAKVNDTQIFKSEIEKKLHNVFDGQSQEIKIPKVENLPKEVIEILIKEVYLDKKLTEEAKKSQLAKSNDVKDRIAEAADKILRQAYVDSLLKQEITDQKVSEKYVELSNELAGKKEYSIFHIVTKTQDEAAKILKILKSKKPSAKFFELAKKYSIDQDSAEKGGELGYIIEDNMIKEISDIAVTLKKDEISNPIQTKFGWHLIKVSDVREAKALPFESVKDNIRDQLSQDKLNDINARITKDAKIQILIELKEPEQKAVEQPPVEQVPTQVELEKEGEVQSDENIEKLEESKVETSEESGAKVAKESDAKSQNKAAQHKK